MKRNMDLIRLLLLNLEASGPDVQTGEIELDGFSEEEIVYHVQILADAGFLKVQDISTMDGDALLIHRITWSGQEFLESAREPTRWEKAMAAVGNVKGVSLPVLQGLLTKLAAQQLGLE